MSNKIKLKIEIKKSNLSEESKKQLISSLEQNKIAEVVKIFISLLHIGSNIMNLLNDKD